MYSKCGNKFKEPYSPREQIIKLLKSTNRDGIELLIDEIDQRGYFKSPASTKYHGTYIGGLADHCFNVYNLFRRNCKHLGVYIPSESVILCSFLHDLCKVGAYVRQGGKYHYKKDHPKGHADLSLKIISDYIKINILEETIIKFHMGIYGTKEFSNYGEYTLKELTDAFNSCKQAKLFYFCDDMSSQFLDKPTVSVTYV